MNLISSIKVENWEEKKPQISDMHKRMTAKIITYDVKPASLIFFSSFDSMLKSSDTTMSFLPILQRNKQQQQQQETACTGSKLSTKTQHSICFQSLPSIPRHSLCPHLRHDSPITSKMECAAASPCCKFALCALSH